MTRVLRQGMSSQEALEVAAGARNEVEVFPGEVTAEGLVGGTARDEGLVEAGVVQVPVEPVLAARTWRSGTRR